MLHPTRLPDCANLLENILDFQERLLELGCSSAQLSPDDFRQALGAEVFGWLDSTNATRKLYQPMYSFARLPQVEKEAILADFRHDRQYIHHLSDNKFQFRLLGDTDDHNRDRIKSWLVEFYERFAKTLGVDGAITGGNAINKDSWWQAYSQGNGGRLTCAVCDGSMNHAITVEHYLPKSRYPVLALHPSNLIPTCDKCNGLKDEKDPLDGRSFQSVVMPYREAIRDLAHLEFVEGQGEVEQIRIVPNNPSSNEAAEKVGTLSALYDLPGQWQRNIHEIGSLAYRRVKQHLRSLQRVGKLPQANQISRELAIVIKWMEEDWGKEHYGYPATEWLRWAAKRNPQALAEEAMNEG